MTCARVLATYSDGANAQLHAFSVFHFVDFTCMIGLLSSCTVCVLHRMVFGEDFAKMFVSGCFGFHWVLGRGTSHDNVAWFDVVRLQAQKLTYIHQRYLTWMPKISAVQEDARLHASRAPPAPQSPRQISVAIPQRNPSRVAPAPLKRKRLVS